MPMAAQERTRAPPTQQAVVAVVLALMPAAPATRAALADSLPAEAAEAGPLGLRLAEAWVALAETARLSSSLTSNNDLHQSDDQSVLHRRRDACWRGMDRV